MTTLIEHRGYYGSVEFSAKDSCLYGALLNVEVPVRYQADSAVGLARAFRDAVDGYITTRGDAAPPTE